MDQALNPEDLKKLVSEDDVVGIVGLRHSGILIVKNLIELEKQPKIIKGFDLGELRFAKI